MGEVLFLFKVQRDQLQLNGYDSARPMGQMRAALQVQKWQLKGDVHKCKLHYFVLKRQVDCNGSRSQTIVTGQGPSSSKDVDARTPLQCMQAPVFPQYAQVPPPLLPQLFPPLYGMNIMMMYVVGIYVLIAVTIALAQSHYAVCRNENAVTCAQTSAACPCTSPGGSQTW